MSLYVQLSPRALVFKPSNSDTCLVIHAKTAYIQPFNTLSCSLLQSFCHGTIGIASIPTANGYELFVGVITDATKMEIDSNFVYRINRLRFYSLDSNRYDSWDESNEDMMEHPCKGLGKLLCTGSFYFSHTLDLTRSYQARQANPGNLFDTLDVEYLWNHSILLPLLNLRDSETERPFLDSSNLIVPIIQGFVGTCTCLIKHAKSKLAIISRLSSRNAGTRYNARGVNDDGHVSNFVETEFLLYRNQQYFSFLQVRGSVPLFWEQTGTQMTHKITISRGPESTQPATQRHFNQIVTRYGNVLALSLLGTSQTSHEYELSEMYKLGVARLDSETRYYVNYIAFDFNAIIRYEYDRTDELTSKLEPNLNELGYFSNERKQVGIVRTNCLDCLDRTNLVQCYITKKVLELYFKSIGIPASIFEDESFSGHFNNLWADNADWLSKVYAGTGALKSSYTRKGKTTLLGFLDDAAKSMNRLYIANFQDHKRQEIIDLLLSEHKNALKHPIHDSVNDLLEEKKSLFTKFGEASIFLGTYNINGKLPGESLDSWLDNVDCDLVVIGLQELIELTPGQYISANTDQLRLVWEAHIMKSLNSRGKYVLIRSVHLVALALFAFVKESSISNIRQVETSVVKTGFGGMAANKGGIGMSLLYHDTEMLFITAHFAAGSSNVEDRNRDYWTITNGLKFKKNKLNNHECIFWFGDFNYRVDCDNDKARSLILSQNFPFLIEMDQLKQNIANQQVFTDFREGPLSFPPTYKYDNGSTNYDTSEKARTPSWTDRILYKGKSITQLSYGRSEQLLSDHRPVKSMFRVTTSIVDSNIKNQLKKRLTSTFTDKSNGSLSNESDTTNPFRESVVKKPAPPLPRRSSQVVIGKLIDIEAKSNPTLVNPFADPTPQPSFPALPPPSSPTVQWWNRDYDTTWIPFEGDDKNPFYQIPTIRSPSNLLD